MNPHDSSARSRDVFGREHVPLPTSAEAALADRAAREHGGVPERVLMENAGRAAALVMQQIQPRGRVVGLAGSGNNGGDLLVMLRVLHGWGRDVTLVAAGSRAPDLSLAHGADVPIISDHDEAERALLAADILVDGMLGTGSSGAPRGTVAGWIETLNATSRPVLALDLPSGVDATSGRVPGAAVRADVTVTFGWPKLGLLLQPTRAYCGRLIAVEIGFPPDCLATTARAITPAFVRRRVRPRDPSAHKGSAGRLLVLAGSRGMAGAAALTAEAANRAGAGLIRIASDEANREILQTLAPLATFLDAAALADDDLQPMHALVAGPGLGTDAAAAAALARVLDALRGRPTLLDADALNLLAQDERALSDVAEHTPLVITPHVAELSRLTGMRIPEILDDAPAAARAAAARFGCVVLLKGQPSVIAEPGGTLYVNTAGSSDTATAGMGDQLAGVVGALLASGMTPLDAATVGLFLSARAADLAALGRSLSPRDVSARLHDAFARPGFVEPPAGLPFVTFDQPPAR